ncbi:unnamed protein product [Durusdinium trenchii]|uniref:Cytochrome b561 domain-containing protein n=2 Tax=Durusdinium trenchii TaxID=1381693 RepID=A0ABP0HB35_9DINO
MAGAAELLYGCHSALELFFGSLMVLRGRGSMDPVEGSTARARLYRRWHGCGLVALSSLGILILLKGKVHEEATSCISAALTIFHGGCVAVHALAATESAAAPKSLGGVAWKEAALSPHIPLTIGFAAHAAGMLP